MEQSPNAKRYGQSPNAKRYLKMLMSGIKSRQRKKWKTCRVDFDERYLCKLLDLQGGKCAQLKTDLTFIRNNATDREASRNPYNASVDRIDSSKPYSRDNIQIVSTMYQIAKSDWADSLLHSTFNIEPPAVMDKAALTELTVQERFIQGFDINSLDIYKHSPANLQSPPNYKIM